VVELAAGELFAVAFLVPEVLALELLAVLAGFVIDPDSLSSSFS
jgi:hypothetical protein